MKQNEVFDSNSLTSILNRIIHLLNIFKSGLENGNSYTLDEYNIHNCQNFSLMIEFDDINGPVIYKTYF